MGCVFIGFRGLCFGPFFTSQCREVSPTGSTVVDLCIKVLAVRLPRVLPGNNAIWIRSRWSRPFRWFLMVRVLMIALCLRCFLLLLILLWTLSILSSFSVICSFMTSLRLALLMLRYVHRRRTRFRLLCCMVASFAMLLRAPNTDILLILLLIALVGVSYAIFRIT